MQHRTLHVGTARLVNLNPTNESRCIQLRLAVERIGAIFSLAIDLVASLWQLERVILKLNGQISLLWNCVESLNREAEVGRSTYLTRGLL